MWIDSISLKKRTPIDSTEYYRIHSQRIDILVFTNVRNPELQKDSLKTKSDAGPAGLEKMKVYCRCHLGQNQH